MITTTTHDESVWWNELKTGNQKAFISLYQKYYPKLISFGKKFTDDIDVIKDSANTLFLNLWEKRAHLGNAKHVGNYLYASFRRNLLQESKYSNRSERLEDIALQNSYEYGIECSSEDKWIANEEVDRIVLQLKAVLLKLPHRQRELLDLKYLKGLSYEDICNHTGLKLRTVYNQINLGLKNLKTESD